MLPVPFLSVISSVFTKTAHPAGIVDDESDAAQKPGNRIPHHDRGHFMPYGDGRHDPDDAQYTYAADGDDRGDHHVPDPPQRAGEDFHGCKDSVKRSQDQDHHEADLQNLPVCGEDTQQRCAEDYHDHGKDERGYNLHTCAHPDTLLDPLVFQRSVILSHERGDRDPKRTADHPVDRIEFPKSSPCGHRIRAEPVERGLDDDVGDAVHGTLQSCGNAYVKLRS